MAHNHCSNESGKQFSRDFEVRKLPISAVLSLTKLLEDQSAWRKVMSLVRKDPPGPGPCPLKYTAEHIRMIEDAASKQHRAATEIFLEEWGCSGKKRPTLKVLLELLVEAQLYGAVDFIARGLLKECPPARPVSGPAAQVVWGDGDQSNLLSNSPPVGLFDPSAPQQPQSFDKNKCSYTLNYSSLGRIPQNDSSLSSTKPNQSLITNGICESHRLEQEMETLCVSQIDRQSVAQCISYAELDAITEGFDIHQGGRLLGSGAFGSVFYAVLRNRPVAVKRLHKDVVDIDVPKHFFNEVEALSRVHHPHLLLLLGYSYDGPAYCLVYEFMSHGNLQERLACKGKWQEYLTWVDRMKISLGTAEGLQHLHSFKPHPILHRDVKSSNILLDTHSFPKIGDFGLVRLSRTGKETQMVTTVIGTSAYMAPEVFRGDVSVKMDVFSLGVVLLELLTSLPPYDEEREGCDLVTHISETCDDSITTLLDVKAGSWRSISGVDISDNLYSLACKCLNEKKDRPEISSVVESLKIMCNS